MYVNDTNVSVFYFYYPPDSQESNIKYARIFLWSVWLVIACNYIRRTRCEKYWTRVRHVLALIFSLDQYSHHNFLLSFHYPKNYSHSWIYLIVNLSKTLWRMYIYYFFLNDNCVINTSKEAGFMYRDKMKYIYK